MDTTLPRQAYDSDLTDEQWSVLEPLLPAVVPAGAPRTTDLREVINAILYRLHNGCAWHNLPHDFPPEGTVRAYFHCWRRQGLWQQINDTLRRHVRKQQFPVSLAEKPIISSQRGNKGAEEREIGEGHQLGARQPPLLLLMVRFFSLRAHSFSAAAEFSLVAPSFLWPVGLARKYPRLFPLPTLVPPGVSDADARSHRQALHRSPASTIR